MNRRKFMVSSALAGVALATVGLPSIATATKVKNTKLPEGKVLVTLEILFVTRAKFDWADLGKPYIDENSDKWFERLFEGLSKFSDLESSDECGNLVDWRNKETWKMIFRHTNSTGVFTGQFIKTKPSGNGEFQFLKSLPGFKSVGYTFTMAGDYDGPEYHVGGVHIWDAKRHPWNNQRLVGFVK